MGKRQIDSVLMWGVAAAYVLFFLSNVLVKVDSRDVWWHLVIGKQIIAARAVPTTDHLTILGEGRSYLDSHWLFQVGLYSLTRVFGLTGLTVYQVLVFGLLFFSYLLRPLFRQRTPSSFLITVAVGAVGICAVSPRFLPRPEALTYLFVSTFILIFERDRRRSTRLIYLIPAMMVLWVNCHALFVLGYFIISAYLAGAVLQLFRPGRFSGSAGIPRIAVVLALSGALFFLNPHGLGLLKYVYLLMTEVGHEAHPLMKSLAELTPTFSIKNIHSLAFACYGVLCLLSAAVFFMRRGRISPAHLLILSVFFGLSLTGSRNMALFAAAALPITITSFLDGEYEFGPAVSRVLAVSAIALLMLQSVRLVTNRHYKETRVARRFGAGVLEESYPAGAVRFIREYRPAGNLGHFDPHGGYYMYYLSPFYRPLFDGRWEIYDQDLIYALFSDLSIPPRFFRRMEGYGVNLYVVDHRKEMNRKLLPYLYRTPDWALVYFDHRSALFVRDIPENRDLIRARRVDLSRSVASLALEVEDIKKQIPQSIMNLLIYLGEKDQAMIVAAKILRQVPGEGQTSEILADYLVQRGKLPEALSVIQAALRRGGGNAHLFSQKAYILMTRNDIQGAVEAMKNAVKRRPDDAAYHFNLALLYLKAGDLSRARGHAKEVKRLEPGRPGLPSLMREVERGLNTNSESGETQK